MTDAVTASVVVLDADAGYGKTTAADVLSEDTARIWYTIGPEDADPFVFLTTILAAIGADGASGDDEWSTTRAGHSAGTPGDWPVLLERLLTRLAEHDVPRCLVLDDYHHVLHSPVDEVVIRMVERMPRRLRLLVTTRERLDLTGWNRLRARGDVIDIGRETLAFEATETSRYFRQAFGVELTMAEAQLVTEETEGWPIGLSLIGQRLRDHEEDPEALLAALPEGRAGIFGLLREQVFHNLPGDQQRFLLAVSCLAELEPDSCAAVAGLSVEAATDALAALTTGGAFCLSDGSGGLYLHHLFGEFLASQLSEEESRTFHRRAAGYFQGVDDPVSAARHLVRARAPDAAATALDGVRDRLLQAGHHATLLDLTEPIVDVLPDHPALLVARSHALRLACRYAEAIDAAMQAQEATASDPGQRARAHEAEVLVHLDTVHPRAAACVLDRVDRDPALRSGPVDWDELRAENQVNSGDLDAAAEVVTRRDRGSTAGRSATHLRLLVRRGHLQRVRALLGDGGGSRSSTIPFAHRERAALRSWVNGLLGFGERAVQCASEGVALGEDLRSPILACVCWGRLGLGHICGDALDLQRAQAALSRALGIAEAIDVARFRAEPLIGMSVIAHRLGEPGDTVRFGMEAIDTLEAADDRYLASLARLGIGAGLADQAHPQAVDWLAEAAQHARRCGDRYIPMVADQWAAHLALCAGDEERFTGHAAAALRVSAALSLDELWVSPSWVAMHDRPARVRWLDAACDLDEVGDYARYLAGRLRRPGVTAATSVDDPSARSLQVRTLGSFQVVRDEEAIAPSAWKRRKAKELFWLLCAADRHSLAREQAMEALWPEASGDAVGGRFRVALHALQSALEPDRRQREPTRFVLASPDRVWLNPSEVEVDIDDFTRRADAALQMVGGERLQASLDALDVYHGPFLADQPYLEWAGPIRTRAASQFRDLALDAATQLSQRGDHARAVRLGQRAMDADPFHDECCRTIVLAYLAAGDRDSAAQVYREWRHRLTHELGVEPDWDLTTL